MVLSKEDFNARLKTILGDNPTDDNIKILEDMTDTYNDLVSKSENKENEDWKAKYEENDKQWRERYTARFFGEDVETNKQDKPDHMFNDPNDLEPETFDELFTDVK